MHLHGHVDDLLRIFGGCHFGHGRLLRNALTLIAQPGGAVGQQCGGVQQGGHLCQFTLRDLKITQGLTKHFALLGPGNRFI